MAKNKTAETEVSVHDFLNAITDEKRRKDCFDLLAVMEKATGYIPKMWGPSIIGFGTYHYRYDSGHEGDAPIAGFASRSNGMVLYLSCEDEESGHLLEKLGKHKLTKSCVYFKKLSDLDLNVLIQLVHRSIAFISQKYPPKNK